MKCRPFSVSVIVVLAVSLGSVTLTVRSMFADDTADATIRLLAEAQRARDSGDTARARRALVELETLTRDDPAVQRLRREIEAQPGAPPQAFAPRKSPVDAPSSASAPDPSVSADPLEATTPTPTPATVEERAPASRPPAPPAGQSENEAEEPPARTEEERIAQLVAKGQAQLAAARMQLREGRFDAAIDSLDPALAAIPMHRGTEVLLADLMKEKAAALLGRAQAVVPGRDLVLARRASTSEGHSAPNSLPADGDRRSGGTAGSPAAARGDAGFAAQRAAVAQLLAKGRAQYEAGDRDGAQETFRAIETREPDNADARSFLLRMAEEKTETGELNREKTRAQLLEEVAKSWQRPGVYQERARPADPAAALAPLQRKLGEILLPAVSWTRAPISEVVMALSAISEEFDPDASGTPKGINVVLLDPTNKSPTVTLTLRNATLKRVLDFVTEQIGYQYEVQPDAVVVRPGGETSTLETQFFPVTRATVLRMSGMSMTTLPAVPGPRDSPSSAGPPAEAATAGEAGAMRAFLTQAGVSFSVEGSALAYDGSAIIVTQTARNLERIRNILARYRDVRQVEIEAKFMEVQAGALEELGVTWNLSRRGVPQINPTTGAPILDANGRQVFVPQETYSTQGVTRPLVRAFPSSANANAINISDATSNLSIPVAPATIPGGVNLAATAAALGNISGFVGEFDVSAAIRALSQKQGTDLLSSPKVTVLSGNPANIIVAQELRYPQSYGEIQSQVGSGAASGTTGISSAGVTITAGTPQEFTSRNVGVELKVTPTVEEDDYSISLDLNPRVTEFEGFVEYGGPSVAISAGVTVTVPPGFYQPIFSVRDIATKVTIWDGATLVMGGLTREEVKKVNDKVPFLGDLPLVGRLFRSQGESAQKRNLLIFVTANLVSPGGSPKNQALKSTPANALFQNPTLVTPAGAEVRTQGAAK